MKYISPFKKGHFMNLDKESEAVKQNPDLITMQLTVENAMKKKGKKDKGVSNTIGSTSIIRDHDAINKIRDLKKKFDEAREKKIEYQKILLE